MNKEYDLDRDIIHLRTHYEKGDVSYRITFIPRHTHKTYIVHKKYEGEDWFYLTSFFSDKEAIVFIEND